jgi:hypothetical protein
MTPVDSSAEAVERAARVLSVGATVTTPTDLADAATLLRALAKDAERYRFIRNQMGSPSPEEFDARVDEDMADAKVHP